MRAEMDFLQNKVDVQCIKDCPDSFVVLDRHVGPFKAGNTYTFYFWIAQILVQEGIVKFEDRDVITSQNIKKINFQESTNPELHKIEENTYLQTLEHLKVMNAWYSKDKIDRREYNLLCSDLNDLIRVRLGKVVRLAMQQQNLKTQTLLTPEEKILYDHLVLNIQEWSNFLSKIK